MNHQLARFDTAALNRGLLGFDTLFSDIETRFANQINNKYPPYNVVKYSDDRYEVQIAVTGFDTSEITVEIDQNQLVIKGRKTLGDDVEDLTFLHRGLASRDFTRMFDLAEYMEVGQGTIKNGVLKIELKRVVPESLKPRVLTITAE